MQLPHELRRTVDELMAQGQGQSLEHAARELGRKHPHTPLPELAVVLHRVQLYLVAKSDLATAMDAPSDDGPVALADVVALAEALRAARPNASAAEVAQALHSPGVYPTLGALELGQALKAPGVFPAITATDMRAALGSTGYTASEIDGAVGQLFPAPPLAQTRRIGPAGNQSMAFDDIDAAQALGQPLSKILVHSGNIVDAIQAFYGDGQSALPHHGGSGGGPTEIPINPSDPIVRISGFYGFWFGGSYILQLDFQTASGQTHGPFGNMRFAASSTSFSLDLAAGERLVALFGSTAYGNNRQSIFLGSLGVVVRS